MSEFKYEIGDEFRTRSRQYWMRIIARHTTRAGVNIYWLEDEAGDPSSHSENMVDKWTKIEPFFEVGDTFTSPWGSSATMTVTHLDDEFKAAWVTVIFEGGNTGKETVSAITWRRVKEEVLRNRKG